uniref:B30.2/SPRY domain-containing protein n=1 Tax=Ficedula albicollis TaxID=59894 RepID=U3KKH7_FICAL
MWEFAGIGGYGGSNLPFPKVEVGIAGLGFCVGSSRYCGWLTWVLPLCFGTQTMDQQLPPFCPAGELSLDPDTANPYLVLSEDKRSVRLRGAPQELPAHPKRFDYAFCVLAAEGFSAGRHYWEVEVGDGESWVLGAARESVRRKEKVDFAPEEGIWAVGLNWKGKNWDQYQAFTSPETPLSLCERPRKIGVYLDYEGGWVAFYNADNMAPIFTFTAAFSERIFPFFWLFYVGSSLSLCN